MSSTTKAWAMRVPVKQPMDRLWLMVLAEQSGMPDPDTGIWRWQTFDAERCRALFGKDDVSNEMHASLIRLSRARLIDVSAIGKTAPGIRVRFATGLEVSW